MLPSVEPRRRSTELNLARYNTDKIAHDYLTVYDPIFAPMVDAPISLLELGIYRGGSMELWRDYFPHGTIVGIDIDLPHDVITGDRIHTFQGDQGDPRFLNEVAHRVAPHGFDVIIDDASHIAALTLASFWPLFDDHLRPGGLYVIEDWGTGYWPDWPDGALATSRNETLLEKIRRRLTKAPAPFRSHEYGMVGLIKQLVDVQGSADLVRGSYTKPSGPPSKFASMTITSSIVFIRKRL